MNYMGYGFGELENQLIDMFCSGEPDFEAAERLVKQGADLNAASSDSIDENILSEILLGYWQTSEAYMSEDACLNCDDDCEDCELNYDRNPNMGQNMVRVVNFFLENGFDVKKNNGLYGAQCLHALANSSFDEHMLEAAKLLFDAGAENLSTDEYDDECTPWFYIGTKCSYYTVVDGDITLAQIYEAFYQMFLAIDENRPYKGIDSYGKAVGKRIIKILADKPSCGEVFYNMDLPQSKHNNCYNSTLYFVYDNGVLISTEYADVWTDTVLPDTELVDVSEKFDGILGRVIKQISFDYKKVEQGSSRYTQPIVCIDMDSRKRLRMTINFGETDNENRTAYYSIEDKI